MKDTWFNNKKYFDILTLFFFTISLAYPILLCISFYYEDFVKFIFATYSHSIESLLVNAKAKLLFKTFKLGLIFVLAGLVYVWFDFFKDKKNKLTLFLTNKVSNTVYLSFQNNKNYICSLQKEIRVAFVALLILFFASLCVFLITIPVSYDELFSYRYFSSNGIWTSLSFYPVPNNHVFYNIISSLFIKLPFDDEILIRLPSILSSIFTIYYFFKLCNSQFEGLISIIITALLISLYPFEIYSLSARGYSFVNLFCVLLLYAALKLTANYKSIKYRWLFILSGFLGTLSVPSFLYVLFPVYTVLLIYTLKQKEKNRLITFFKDGFISLLLIIIGYSFILFLNDPKNLTVPNGGATKFSLHDVKAFSIIIGHLKELSDYLFPYKIALLLIIVIFIFLVRNKEKNQFLIIMCLFMIVSPIMILLIHHMLPFQRTWLYLVFPSCICIGYALQIMYHKIPRYVFLSKLNFRTNLLVFSIALAIFFISKFENNHKYTSNIDFEIKGVREKYFNARLRNIESIALTRKGFEFYPAEFLLNICYKLDPKRQVDLLQLDSVRNQDVLVIDKAEMEHFKPQLLNYYLIANFDENIVIFIKK